MYFFYKTWLMCFELYKFCVYIIKMSQMLSGEFKGIIIHMHFSFIWCFPFCSKQEAAIFNHLRIQINQQDTHKHEFCLPYNYTGEVLSFLFCSKSFKTWFFKKVSFLSSANWIFTRKHVHFTMMSQEVHLFWVCLSIWLDQFCVNFVLK